MASETLLGFINRIKEISIKDIPFEKVEASLKAAALFDALGSPHEHFNEDWNPSHERFKINGKCNIGNQFFPIIRKNRFKGNYYQYLTSQFTDDTSMAICIMRNVVNMLKSKPENISFEDYFIQNKGAFKVNQVMLYMDWVNNSGCSFMGHNTRELFGHIKTYKTYLKRVDEKEKLMQHTNYGICIPREIDNTNISMANGVQMRFGILATLPLEIAITDCMITNNNPINIECSILMWCIFRLCVLGKSKENIKSFLLECLKYYHENKKSICELILPNIAIPFETDQELNKAYWELMSAIVSGIEKNYKGDLKGFMKSETIDNSKIKLTFTDNGLDIIPKCGYAIYGIYCLIYTLLNFNNYSDSIKWIINKLGDTDTNGAIAAYILGAYYGLNKLEDEYKLLIDQQFNILPSDENKYYGHGFGPIAFTEALEELKNFWKKQ